MSNGPVSNRSWIAEAFDALHSRRVLHQRDVMERPLLDTIRWASALTVVVGHAMGLVFTRTATGPAFPHILDMLSDLRGTAVVLFFVISGYLVGGGVLLRAGSLDMRRYAIARFARIYIVLLPAILVICLLDGTAHLIDPASPVYAGVWQSGVLGGAPIDTRYSLANWAATILSLESIVAPPAGTGNALWSLGYEWVFYFVFPAMVLPLARFRSLLLPLLPIAVAMVVLVLIGRKFDAVYFGIWVAGAYARVLVDHAAVPAWVAWGGAILAALSLMMTQVAVPILFMTLVGVGFAIYLSRFTQGERGLSRRFDRAFADMSYSLYVTHFPVMIFLVFLLTRAGILSPAGLPASFVPAMLMIGLTAACVVVAWVFGRTFEARTDALRAWLSALLGVRASR